jgi:hypothetical protein
MAKSRIRRAAKWLFLAALLIAVGLAFSVKKVIRLGAGTGTPGYAISFRFHAACSVFYDPPKGSVSFQVHHTSPKSGHDYYVAVWVGGVNDLQYSLTRPKRE